VEEGFHDGDFGNKKKKTPPPYEGWGSFGYLLISDLKV
jgi:hypothetical protein